MPLIIPGGGKSKRQFIYSRDFASILLLVLREYTKVEPLIISGSPATEISIGEVVKEIVIATDFKGPVVVRPQADLMENG